MGITLVKSRYSKDMKVRVKDRHGTIVEGVILQPADFGGKPRWWIKFQDYFTGGLPFDEVTIISEDELDRINGVYSGTKCTCGASSVGHKTHVYYCDLYVKP
jgi:hypothetical protein